MTAPIKVSDREREEHGLTHTPFRAWCPYCVRARGRNTSHLVNQGINKDKPNEVPRMSMKYFFTSQENEIASANPIMVMAAERTVEKFARAVGRKGMGKDQDMEWSALGRGKHHPEVGLRTSFSCNTRCSGEVP